MVYNKAVYTPLKEYLLDAHLTVLVARPSYDLVCEHSDIDKVLCFEKEIVVGQIKFYFVFGKFDG